MQSGIIDEILAVEDEAEKIVQDAQTEARRLVSEAHNRAAEIISDKVEAARKEGQQMLEDAEARMRDTMKEYEDERLSVKKAGAAIPPEVVSRATDRIVGRILSIGE